MKNKKPPKCTHPNCFECPYVECRYDRLEVEDFTETNKRDYELYEADTGRKYHKGTDLEYRRNREVAYQRRNRKYVDRHDYNQRYYQENRESVLEKCRENYDTKRNTVRCRKYIRKHKAEKKAYDSEYYQKNKEKKKQQAREYYLKRKAAKEMAYESRENVILND